jgi:thiamine-phosphate pyrophosphorylase
MISPLYPILDAGFLPLPGPEREERLRSWMAELLSAGVTLLQYRNKSGDEAEVLADALVLRVTAPVRQCVLILNDYPALADEAGFDGVHVGQGDMSPEQARALIGDGKMLGVSTHSPEQLSVAELSSADYVAIGPVFATSTKLNSDPVVGVKGVRRARAMTSKPLVAIGGIMLENCRAVLDAGADSVAVISAIFAPSLRADGSGETPGKIASDFFAKLR